MVNNDMPKSYIYTVQFNGVDHMCHSIFSVCERLNTQCGFAVATPNVIYNLITRPGTGSRSRLPGLVITRRPLCISSGYPPSAPYFLSLFSSLLHLPHIYSKDKYAVSYSILSSCRFDRE